MQRSILVTGGSGFIGSAVVQHLLRNGSAAVTVLSRQPRSQTPSSRITHIEGDITQSGRWQDSVATHDAVCHSAGLAHVLRQSRTTEQQLEDVNVAGTRHVARLCRLARVPRMLLVSSVSVYGPSSNVDRGESARCSPQTSYGLSKLAAEAAAHEELTGSETELVTLRLATVYGEGDRGNVLRLIRMIDRGFRFGLGSGAAKKTLVHIEDAATAIAYCVLSGNRIAGIYNVGGAPERLRTIVDLIGHHLGRRIYWPIGDPALLSASVAARAAMSMGITSGQTVHQMLSKWSAVDDYSSEAIRKTIGWAPLVPLSEGIDREVQWYRRSKRPTAAH